VTTPSLPIPGDPAPDFTLRNQYGQSVSLSGLRRESSVALVFFPLAFSSTCTAEWDELREHRALFAEAGVTVVGISVDSTASLRAFAESGRIEFSLLADFWPHGDVAERYGAFLPEKGFATRATVLVDTGGIVRASFASDPGEARPFVAYRAALDAL
jgi:peroxiredoxin